MSAQYTLTAFTPREAENITGLTTTMQRDWRRRGFLPSSDSHARFDIIGLGEAWVMKMLADRGIGPQVSKDVAHWCAVGIAWHALLWADSYEGDHRRVFEWLPEDQRPKANPPTNVRHMLEKLRQENPEFGSEPYDYSWGPKGEWLAKQVLRLKGLGRAIPGRFFIWWADGSHYFHVSLDEAFSQSSFEARYAGPCVVLDLNALSSTLGERAGRAFVHVEFESDPETGEIAQPIEYGPAIPLNRPAKSET